MITMMMLMLKWMKKKIEIKKITYDKKPTPKPPSAERRPIVVVDLVVDPLWTLTDRPNERMNGQIND